jgi:HAD superfamily hydrolase (TIGR01458 family)
MIRGVLLDLSGVLYLGDEVLPGALAGVGRLAGAGLAVRYVTNTTRSPRSTIMAKLSRLGFSIREDEVYTAPLAARDYCEAHGLTAFLVVHPNLEGELADISRGVANAVLLGDAGPGFSYGRLNAAFRLVLEGAPLLAMGDNRYFKEPDGFSLDVGPFVAALEYAADTRARVLGKPSADFFHAAVASLGCSAEEAVMVGDDVHADVLGAVRTGLQGLLVKTGKYRPGDEDLLEGPAAVLEDVAAAVDWTIARA